MKILGLLAATMISSVAMAAPTSFKIDTKASSITWLGSKVTKASHDGNIQFSGGSIEIEKGEIKGGNFTVDMNTITNNDLKDSAEYQAKLVGHLKNEDFFDVQKHPTSTFKITSVAKKSASEVVIKGDFTMIGKTVAIEFPAKIDIKGDSATGEAVLKLDRTQWGLKYGSGKFFQGLGDKMINDEFQLTMKIVAKK